jgi:hypothetical protein
MSQNDTKSSNSDDEKSENEDMTKEQKEDAFAEALGEIWITSSTLPFFCHTYVTNFSIYSLW